MASEAICPADLVQSLETHEIARYNGFYADTHRLKCPLVGFW